MGKKETTRRKRIVALATAVTVGAGLTVFSLSRRAAGLENIYLEPRGIRVARKDVRLTGANGILQLGVSNPSDIPITVRDIFAQYMYQGTRLGETGYPGTWTIPRRQTTVLDVPVSLSWAGVGTVLLQTIMKAIRGEQIKIENIEMQGKATVNGLDFTIDTEIELTTE